MTSKMKYDGYRFCFKCKKAVTKKDCIIIETISLTRYYHILCWSKDEEKVESCKCGCK